MANTLTNLWTWWVGVIRDMYAVRGYYERMDGDMEIYAIVALMLVAGAIMTLVVCVVDLLKRHREAKRRREERQERELARKAEQMTLRIQAAMLFELAAKFAEGIASPSSEPEDLDDACNRVMAAPIIPTKVVGLEELLHDLA